MAYGRKCCQNGLKAYFLKATELNQRLTDARKYGRESSTINGLVKPSCLIIDEIGRCVFDKENTRMFFDVIDRRYNKEGPNTMIFTSNKGPEGPDIEYVFFDLRYGYPGALLLLRHHM